MIIIISKNRIFRNFQKVQNFYLFHIFIILFIKLIIFKYKRIRNWTICHLFKSLNFYFQGSRGIHILNSKNDIYI